MTDQFTDLKLCPFCGGPLPCATHNMRAPAQAPRRPMPVKHYTGMPGASINGEVIYDWLMDDGSVEAMTASDVAARRAAQSPVAPVDQERLAELQNEAGMYKSLYENAVAQRSSAGTIEALNAARRYLVEEAASSSVWSTIDNAKTVAAIDAALASIDAPQAAQVSAGRASALADEIDAARSLNAETEGDSAHSALRIHAVRQLQEVLWNNRAEIAAYLRLVPAPQEAREPDAWEWRACIGGRWGSWLHLDQPLERFTDRNRFNLDNGTYELRPLYAGATIALSRPEGKTGGAA